MSFNGILRSAAAVTVSLLAFSQVGYAAPIVINDNYVGGGATDSGYATSDVIGDNNLFGISKMEVDLTAGQLSISVFSSYFNNVGQFGTDLGDLFITTSGWNPVGPSPYYNDQKSTTGTNWEYALVINHTKPGAGDVVDMLGTSGTVSLYQIPSQSLLVTSNASSGIYRGDQIVKLDTTNLSPIAGGSWSMSDVIGSEFDQMTVNILASSLAGLSSTAGFRWEMDCANDVIEGNALFTSTTTVPEPMTLGLLSAGLLGAGFRKRRAA